jgi:hypothetical protein
MRNSVFDFESNLGNLQSVIDSSRGKVFDMCTVRSSSVSDTSLGTLFWMLIARRLANAGAMVNVYDFPDKGSSDVVPAREIADLLEINNINIFRAEDQDQSAARSALESFSKAYISSPSCYPGIRPSVCDGLLKSEDGLDSSLDRMVEELSVFLNGMNDSNHIQLMGHERETVQLIRYLADVDKKYERLDLGGIESEFRAIKIPNVKEFPDRLMVGGSQGRAYYDFFMYVLNDLADALYGVAETRCYQPNEGVDWGLSDDFEMKIAQDIRSTTRSLNSRLYPYVVSCLIDKGKEFSIINRELVRSEIYKASTVLAQTANPDYNWVLRLLSVVDTNRNTITGLARTTIHNALPTLDAEELFYHGDRFWRRNNRGRANLLFKAYLDRGYRDRITDIYGLCSGVCGAASEELCGFLDAVK